MNIILVETIKHPIGSFVDQVKKSFPRSSVIYATNRNIPDVLKTVNKPPSLSPRWLILINMREVSDDILVTLNTDDNVNVYIVRSRDSARDLSNKFDVLGIKYRVVDNLNPSEETLIKHICSELSVEEDLAMYIIRRSRRSLTKISETIDILKSMEDIDRNLIKKYVDNTVEVSLFEFFDYIIGVDERITQTKAISVIKRFKFGLDYLLKFVLKRMENYLVVYEHIMSGELSLENYRMFYENKKTSFKDFNEYSVKSAIEAFPTVSYDKLYYLYWMYQREKDSGISLLRFLNLLRLSQ